ncbi:hypothetical protein CSC45_5476 [Pseudomonas aeruginosa]|nr:hypothetical protein CSB90_0923 [Pseudomonas aeruginosa]RCH41295.1 hypothetical protein CSC45_5476 [Pseudomonas aeruginosa]
MSSGIRPVDGGVRTAAWISSSRLQSKGCASSWRWPVSVGEKAPRVAGEACRAGLAMPVKAAFSTGFRRISTEKGSWAPDGEASR